jgi:hypothetical protein
MSGDLELVDGNMALTEYSQVFINKKKKEAFNVLWSPL